MTKASGNISVKNFYIGLGILALLGGLGIFQSSADVRSTVDTVVTQEIKDDNKTDDAKFFGKVEGAKLQEQVKYNGEKIDEVNDKIRDIDNKMDRQLQLLYKINAKLKDSG